MDKKICFFGPDGSGKTTLGRLLVYYYIRKKKVKIRKVWFRGTHTLASLLAKFLSSFHLFKGDDNPYYEIRVPISLRPLWQFIEFISIFPIIFLNYIIYPLLGYFIISERSIPDFIVWVSITTNDFTFLNKNYATFLLSLSNKICDNIYVSAHPLVLLKRRKSENDEYFMLKQLALYNFLSKKINSKVVDTSEESIQKNFVRLLKLIN